MFLTLLLISSLLSFNIVAPTTIEEDLTLTLQEKQLLDKFKQEVSPYLYKDYMNEEIYLVRWLRDTHNIVNFQLHIEFNLIINLAKNFNLEEAKSMLLKNIQWRRKNNIDSILTEDFSDIAPYVNYKILGQAKNKNPGSADLRKMYLAGKSLRAERFMDRYLEEITTVARSLHSQNVTQYDLIGNLEGLNIAQHACLGCMPSILYHFVSYENHYPGAIDKLIFLNANSAVGVILEATKAVLSQRTRNIVEIYGTNRIHWIKRLLEIFDTEILPVQIGGSASIDFEEI